MAPLVGVLLGEAPTSAKAQRLADIFQPCPYCVSCTSARRTVIGVFTLPPDHGWWLEGIAEQPEETLGLKRAEVFFTQQIEASSPWTRGEVKPKLERAPCGTDCRECPWYPQECEGCPATLHYVAKT
jgi:hypothetical protein